MTSMRALEMVSDVCVSDATPSAPGGERFTARPRSGRPARWRYGWSGAHVRGIDVADGKITRKLASSG
jgi:hypothetical protein